MPNQISYIKINPGLEIKLVSFWNPFSFSIKIAIIQPGQFLYTVYQSSFILAYKCHEVGDDSIMDSCRLQFWGSRDKILSTWRAVWARGIAKNCCFDKLRVRLGVADQLCNLCVPVYLESRIFVVSALEGFSTTGTSKWKLRKNSIAKNIH
jgi:hypothetical protein